MNIKFLIIQFKDLWYSVKRVTNTKYFRIIYNYNLKWNLHINNIIYVYLLQPLYSTGYEKNISNKKLFKIYYSIFQSIETYVIDCGGLN